MAFSLLFCAFVIFMVGGSGGRRKRTKRACTRKSTQGESSSAPSNPESYRAYCDETLVGTETEHFVGATAIYRTDEAMYRHRNLFNHCTVMGERTIKIDDFSNTLISRVVRERGWENITDYSVAPNITWVKEFYTNADLYFSESNYIHCFVRTKIFHITPRILSRYFNAHIVNNPQFPFTENNKPSLNAVASLLTGVERVWDGIASTLKHSELTPDFAVLHVFVSANLCPVLHTTTVNKDKAYMMYALATNVTIDLGTYIFKLIVNACEKSKKNSSLPFGSLITSLCRQVRCRVDTSDIIGTLGPKYNFAAYKKRLTVINRARNVPNVGVNLGNDPGENIHDQPMPQQGENAYSMENMWNMINNINNNVIDLCANQNSLRDLVISQHQTMNERLDTIEDRIAFYHNSRNFQQQDDDDGEDDDNDNDEDDDGDDDDGMA